MFESYKISSISNWQCYLSRKKSHIT